MEGSENSNDDDVPSLKPSTTAPIVTDEHVLQEPDTPDDFSPHRKEVMGPIHSFKGIDLKQNSPKTNTKTKNQTTPFKLIQNQTTTFITFPIVNKIYRVKLHKFKIFNNNNKKEKQRHILGQGLT